MPHADLLETVAELWEQDQAAADVAWLVTALGAPYDVVRKAVQASMQDGLIEIAPDSPFTLVEAARLRLTHAGWDAIDEAASADPQGAVEHRLQVYLAASARLHALDEHPMGNPEVTPFPTVNGELGHAMDSAELEEYRYGRAVERYHRATTASL